MEKQLEDPGCLLMCNDKDIFAKDPLTASQLVAFVDPVVPARSAEVEKALQPILGLDWSQEVEDRDSSHLEHCSVEQEEGLVDPSFSPSPVEPLSQGGSREEVEHRSYQSEPSEKVQGFVLEAQCMTSYQETLD